MSTVATTPDTSVNAVALTIVIILFLLVTVLGFLSVRWRRTGGLASLDPGRRPGPGR